MKIIPFFGLARQYANIRSEILDAADQVYSTGRVLDGEYTKHFEQAIAARCNRAFAVAVNSGTQALIFAQLASMSRPPYSILIPTVSFVATINSVLMNKFTPVFCDVDYKGLMDINSFHHKLDRTVGAVMYVNLFGNCVDWDRFQMQTRFFNDDLVIIEDAAQSFGASYRGIPSGKMGDISVLSFDPTKNLGNYGSGGMILTDDLHIANTVRGLRDNGKPITYLYHNDTPGTNSKMSESDSAQMLVKLNHFDSWQRRRTEIAEYYTQELYQYVDLLNPNKDVVHAWHKFVIRTHDRTALQAKLSWHGIESKIHYDYALYDLGVGASYIDYTKDIYTETNSFTKECLSLPIYPELSDAEVETVVAVVKNFYTD